MSKNRTINEHEIPPGVGTLLVAHAFKNHARIEFYSMFGWVLNYYTPLGIRVWHMANLHVESFNPIFRFVTLILHRKTLELKNDH